MLVAVVWLTGAAHTWHRGSPLVSNAALLVTVCLFEFLVSTLYLPNHDNISVHLPYSGWSWLPMSVNRLRGLI